MKRKPIDILTEIRMHRASRPNETALLVEGRADSSYFRRIVCPRKCRVYPCDGKVFALGTAKLALDKAVPGVVAILDRDHDRLLNREFAHRNVLYTDENDFETTIVRSKAFVEYLHEFLDYEDYERVHRSSAEGSIGENVLRMSGGIGVLRFLNILHTWDLKCRAIELHQIVDLEHMEIDLVKLVSHVHCLSACPRIDLDSATQMLLETSESIDDLTAYATGHDTTGLLALLLSASVLTDVPHDVCRDQVERGLRLVYSSQHFRETETFASLRHWEQENSPFEVFSI